MAIVIVIYDSHRHFTERMAKAVAEGVKSVPNVTVELQKIGTPFSLRRLKTVDAIILGSPTIYNNVSPLMQNFLDVIDELKDRLQLPGKIGGVFGSYSWDEGQVVELLSTRMEALGISVIPPKVSVFNGFTKIYSDIQQEGPDKESLQQCHKLGQVIGQRVIDKT